MGKKPFDALLWPDGYKPDIDAMLTPPDIRYRVGRLMMFLQVAFEEWAALRRGGDFEKADLLKSIFDRCDIQCAVEGGKDAQTHHMQFGMRFFCDDAAPVFVGFRPDGFSPPGTGD